PPDHLDAEVQVGVHAPDHEELLVVLLPEEGTVRAAEGENLGDDGDHAAKVPRPLLTLERDGERPRLHPGLESRRVHLLGPLGRYYERSACLLALAQV